LTFIVKRPLVKNVKRVVDASGNVIGIFTKSKSPFVIFIGQLQSIPFLAKSFGQTSSLKRCGIAILRNSQKSSYSHEPTWRPAAL
jgi:hypothetical protein